MIKAAWVGVAAAWAGWPCRAGRVALGTVPAVSFGNAASFGNAGSGAGAHAGRVWAV